MKPIKIDLFLCTFLVLILCQCQMKDEKQHKVTGLGMPPEQIGLGSDSTFDLQGHRGARGLLPENSIEGFIKAIDLGVRTLELDVVVSKDQQIIISHEPFFSHLICKTAQGDSILPAEEKKMNIYEMTLAQIQSFDCGSWGNPRFPEQVKMKTSKPTLKEMVLQIEKYLSEKQLPPVFYNIETKSSPEGDSIFHPAPNEFAKLLYQEILALNIKERVFIQSFDVRTLQVFKTLDEEIPLVLLVENREGIQRNIEKLGFTPSVYSPYFVNLTEEQVKKAKSLGMKVIPWTVNEPEDMRRMLKIGVDGLITDYPNRFNKIRYSKTTQNN